ncbi:uncharacterized protein B0H64DRAFT_157725 [Chaetomium fimeti]|uniref:C2H2-type domain-containing protein n=1 Tax=Chaetomium fimeti TaxID=1854472 RepID=A0AAE0LSH5_9PEZI|nr:hypothetical protein B0H64DRAFT_157725 [Chaetomium fimeti]
MRTDAASHSAQVPVSDLYDPDDVLPKNSPLLEPRHPTLQLSPSPAPTLSPSPVSPPGGKKKSKRRRGPRPSQGDVILMGHLDEYRRGTAAYAADLNLEWKSETDKTEDSEDPEDQGDAEDSGLRADSMSARDASPEEQQVDEEKDREGSSRINGKETGIQGKASSSSTEEDMGALDLKSLAAGALAAFTEPEPDAGPTPPVTENDVVGGKAHPVSTPSMAIHTRRTEFRQNERNPPPTMPSPHSMYSPGGTGQTPSSQRMDMRSPTASIHSNSHSEGLPPLLNSPRYESNAQTLPSIRSQLGDIPQLANNHGVGNGMRSSSHHGFAGSPPANMTRFPPLHSQLASPPIPPAEPHRDPLSPTHPLAPPTISPRYYYHQPNGLHQSHDYAGNSPEAAGSHQSGSPPVAPGLDRMSLDGIQTVGSYVCKVPGCNAPAFQTQYLLNSHANVHSSARPHYCPVPGCPRAEGGKGFKRKNEMIRHGLVHESPGYICPFCPDRDHRYPRPDNLQRHVRVHHVDKDKDDPLLRDVLAQRPDGPSRGRRRRGVAA